MTLHQTPVAARHLPCAEFEQAITCIDSAERHAEKLVADAQREADEISALRESEEASLAALKEQVREVVYLDELARANIERRAKAAADVLDEAALIRTEFESLTPWLADLVVSCLRKIIGQTDQADLIVATVTEAVKELASDQRITLRVAASDFDELKAIMKRHPDRFDAVAGIIPDAALPDGAVHLEGSGGLVNIGIEAQLEALRDHIETHIKHPELRE